jgi:hypothetical protein
MKPEFSRQILEQYFNIKFHENPPCGSRVVPYGWTDRRRDRRKDGRPERQIYAKKLIVSFRNFANALKENVDCQWEVRELCLTYWVVCCQYSNSKTTTKLAYREDFKS